MAASKRGSKKKPANFGSAGAKLFGEFMMRL